MTSRAFKSGIERVLRSLGFAGAGSLLARHDLDIWTLIGFDKGSGDQWHINVGFWIDALGGPPPEKLERSHAYFRLERLVPELHETITSAGSLGEPEQPRAYDELLRALPEVVEAELRRLGTEAGLRKALARGRLMNGLIRKEARARLSIPS